MPSNKTFSVTVLEGLHFVEKKLDMYEIHEHYTKNIETALKYLDEGKTVCYEKIIEDKAYTAMYWIKRNDVNRFSVHVTANNFEETIEKTSNELLNMLYKQAPFIVVVGYTAS